MASPPLLWRTPMIRLLAAAVAVWVFAAQAPATREERAAPSANWRRVELTDFGFDLPRRMKEQKVRGVDSLVWEYRGGGSRLAIDYGMHSNDLRAMAATAGAHAGWVSIDGQRANVVTSRSGKSYVAAVHFPDLGGDAASGRTKLTLSMEVSSPDGLADAQKIFQSIRFTRTPGIGRGTVTTSYQDDRDRRNARRPDRRAIRPNCSTRRPSGRSRPRNCASSCRRRSRRSPAIGVSMFTSIAVV
jgi:hypothetical protein